MTTIQERLIREGHPEFTGLEFIGLRALNGRLAIRIGNQRREMRKIRSEMARLLQQISYLQNSRTENLRKLADARATISTLEIAVTELTNIPMNLPEPVGV